MLIHLNLKPYKCDVCGDAFGTVQNVGRHKMIAHVPTGAYKCSNCSCQFERHRSLAHHMGHRHPLHSPEERIIR
jgi:DNA-directed RNA polymerase subunit RPC12/RpoP